VFADSSQITSDERVATPKSIPAAALTELTELASRAMHSLGYVAGLYPAQWTALRYFSRAGDGLRTASELARFQGLATGPVSRTVRTLLLKGLIRKSDNQPAGRAEHLEVTATGRDMLTRDPLREVTAAFDKLGDGEREALANALEIVIRAAASVWPAHQRGEAGEPTDDAGGKVRA
jgi:DNA-binding MarR family transcriptional regulator